MQEQEDLNMFATVSRDDCFLDCLQSEKTQLANTLAC